MTSCGCDYRAWDPDLVSAVRSVLPQLDDDMDPYYFLQLVDNLKDRELKRRIELELRMREGTARLLAAANTAEQNIFAARSMLVSNKRMNAYTDELRNRKHRRHHGTEEPSACKATVAISHLRVPLLWKNSDHFKNKGENRRFSVFCLVSSGCEVLETRLIQDVDRSSTDIDFGDVIVIPDQSSDFELLVEVMVHEQQDETTVVGLVPTRTRRKLGDRANSVGRSVGRKLSGLREEMENMFLGPKFDRIAYTTVQLDGVSGTVQSFDLTTDSSSPLPLFGTCCFQVSVRPQCMDGIVACGQLSLQKEDRTWNELYAELSSSYLRCWNSSQKPTADPVLTVPIQKHANVVVCTNGDFEINSDEQCYYCSGSSHVNWPSILKQHVHNQVVWGAVCELDMQIPEVPKMRHGVPVTRTMSLYDEVIAKAQSPPSTMTRSKDRRKSVR